MEEDTKRGYEPSARMRRYGRTALSARDLKFIDEFMKDRNAVQACKRMGYSKWYSKRGHLFMQNPNVRAEVDKRESERATRVDIKSDDILREVKGIAFFDVRKMFDPHTGKFIVNPHEMAEEDARALVNFDIVVLNKEGDYIVKLQPGNKLKALELLGKNQKLWTEKVEHSGHTQVTYSVDYGDGDKPDDAAAKKE